MVATLLQVRADWRRRRSDQVTEGASNVLASVDAAMAALDELAEAGGAAEATNKKFQEELAAVEASRSALTTAPLPDELAPYNDLMDEIHDAMRWPGTERTVVVRATIDRVMAELPAALENSEDAEVRRQAITLGRALSRTTLAGQQLLDVHLRAHQYIDAVRAQRSRLAIALASVPTRAAVLECAEELHQLLNAFRVEIDEAIFADQDPRSQPVALARQACRTGVDAFCESIADAVEGPASRRWRWRL